MIADICQIEIRGRDVARAAAFYRHALGWRIAPSDDPTVRLVLTGSTIPIALVNTLDARVPLGFVPFVGISDCDASVAHAADLGATVVVPLTDAVNAEAWAVCRDPWGNDLGFVEGAGGAAFGWDDAAVHPVVWIEMRAPDVVAAIRYYRRLCGWRFNFVPGMSGFAFYWGGDDTVGIGLVGGARADRMRRVTGYVDTPDLERSLATARAAGAPLLTRTRRTAEGGRFAVVADPDDNPVGIFEPASE